MDNKDASNPGIFRRFITTLMTEGKSRKDLTGFWKGLIAVVAIAMSLFQVWSVTWGALDPFAQGAVHVSFVLMITFLYYGFSKKKYSKKPTLIEVIFTILALAAAVYFILNNDRISFRKSMFDPLTSLDIFFGVVYILLSLEAARRTIGAPIVIVVIVFLVYTLFGQNLGGLWGHRVLSVTDVIDQLAFSLNGIWGSPIAVASTFVFIFVLFGAFLQKSGAGNFFFDISSAITGTARGGPAKVAIFASALFGTISGSPTANVVTTGSFTIPMSKRLGYRPVFAGAVEAVASTGGSIMPPVMGSSAFLMAEVTGIPYGKIVVAAIIPALLYYLSLFMMVHFEAVRVNLPRLKKEDIPRSRDVMAKGWQYLVPLVVMTWLLVIGKSPSLTGVYAILAVIAVSWFRKDTRMGIKEILDALEDGARTAVPVTTACAAAGMVIAGIVSTGLGGKLTSIILGATNGMLFPTLLVTMIICIILGMGMPVAAAYVLTAMLAAPALMSMGIPKMPAHLFIVYFSIISAITPPVAVAAFAAAGIAEANPNRVGFEATRLGIAAFIVPFMFVVQPALLMQGPILPIIQSAITASIGVTLLAGGVIGWFVTRASWPERVLLIIAGLGLIDPGALTDIIGIGIGVAVFLYQKFYKNKVEKIAV